MSAVQYGQFQNARYPLVDKSYYNSSKQ